MALILPSGKTTRGKKGNLMLPGQTREPKREPERNFSLIDFTSGKNTFGVKTSTPPIKLKLERDTYLTPSPEGIEVQDIIREIPTGAKKTARAIGRFGKEVAKSIARNIASAGITIAGKIAPKKLKPFIEPLRVEDFESFFTQALVETVFGEKPEEADFAPTKSIEQRIAEAEPKVKKWQQELEETLKTPELNTRERIVIETLANLKPEGLAFLGIMGSVGIDLSPWGGSSKSLYRAMRGVKTEGESLILLQRAGVADDLAKNFAPDVVKVNTEKQAANLFNRITNLQQTTRKTTDVMAVLPPTVKKLLGEKPAPTVKPRRTREDTALRVKLKAEQAAAKRGARAGEKVGKTRAEAVVAEKTAQKLRQQELRNLKEGIKVRLKALERGIREGAIATRTEIKEAQNELRQIIQANIPKAEQGAFLPVIERIKSKEALEKELPDILRRIGDTLERGDVRVLRKKIDKELKKTVLKKDPSGVLKSEFTPEKQEKLDKIRSFTTLKVVEAERQLDDLLELVQKSEDITPEIAERIRLLRYSARENLTSAELNLLLDDIRSIKTEGKTLAELRKGEAEVRIQRQVDQMVPDILGELEPKAGVFPAQNPTYNDSFLGKARRALSDYFNSTKSYEFIMDDLTQAKQHEILEGSLAEHATRHRRLVGQQLNGEALGFEELNKGLARSFDVAVEKVNTVYDKLFARKEIGTFTDIFHQKVTLDMTTDESIYLYNLLKDETLIPTFKETMGWTDEMINVLRKSLSSQEKKYADFLTDEFYPQYFEGFDDVSLSSVYQRRFGTDFRPRTNYTPLGRELDKPVYLEQLNDTIQQLSTKPGQIKARTANKFPIKVRGATDMAVKYVNDMERFKHLSEYIDDTRKIFHNKEFRQAVLQTKKDGQRYLDLLDDTIEAIWRGQRKFEDRVLWVDSLKGFGATGLLGLNPTQIPKQLTSVVASMSRVPIGEWSLGFANFFKNPQKNFKILSESSLLKARYKQANFSQELAQARRDGFIEKMSGKTPWREKILFMTRYGDLGGIVGAGWPVYRYELAQGLKKGLSQKDAHKRALAAFEDNFSQTQTSARMGDVGKIQRGNSWGALWTLFMNSPLQYNRFALSAFKNLTTGKGTKKQNAKTAFIFWSLLPTLFGLAAQPQDVPNLFRGGEKGSRARKRVAVNVIAGGTQYQIIWGSAVYNLARGLAGLPTFRFDTEPTPFTVFAEIGRSTESLIDEIKDISKSGDISAEDVFEAIQEFEKAVTLGTGVPVENVSKLAKNYWEVFSGDSDNYLKLFGYSDWALDSDIRDAPIERERTRVREREAPARRERVRTRDR